MEFFSIMENRVDQLKVVKKRKYVYNMRVEEKKGVVQIELLSDLCPLCKPILTV